MGGHPLDYHKSEEARARCHGCSHPEKLEITEEIRVEAVKLIDEKWYQVSGSSRMVARLPMGKTGTQALLDWQIDRRGDYIEWVLGMGEAHAGDFFLRCNNSVERKELSPALWRAYKKAGGGTYDAANWQGDPRRRLVLWIHTRALSSEDKQAALDVLRLIKDDMERDCAAHVREQLKKGQVDDRG